MTGKAPEPDQTPPEFLKINPEFTYSILIHRAFVGVNDRAAIFQLYPDDEHKIDEK